jgi:hypothetical protein
MLDLAIHFIATNNLLHQYFGKNLSTGRQYKLDTKTTSFNKSMGPWGHIDGFDLSLISTPS